MTRIKIVCTVLAMLWPALFFAQKYDYVWEFGEPELIHLDYGGTTFDFNSNPINIYRTARWVHFDVSNASICNDIGKLLYYTNGCAVYNSDDQIIDT